MGLAPARCCPCARAPARVFVGYLDLTGWASDVSGTDVRERGAASGGEDQRRRASTFIHVRGPCALGRCSQAWFAGRSNGASVEDSWKGESLAGQAVDGNHRLRSSRVVGLGRFPAARCSTAVISC